MDNHLLCFCCHGEYEEWDCLARSPRSLARSAFGNRNERRERHFLPPSRGDLLITYLIGRNSRSLPVRCRRRRRPRSVCAVGSGARRRRSCAHRPFLPLYCSALLMTLFSAWCASSSITSSSVSQSVSQRVRSPFPWLREADAPSPVPTTAYDLHLPFLPRIDNCNVSDL